MNFFSPNRIDKTLEPKSQQLLSKRFITGPPHANFNAKKTLELLRRDHSEGRLGDSLHVHPMTIPLPEKLRYYGMVGRLGDSL